MALIFQLDSAAVEEFYTLLYCHNKSLKYKNNTVGQSLFPESNGGFHPPKTHGLEWMGC